MLLKIPVSWNQYFFYLVDSLTQQYKHIFLWVSTVRKATFKWKEVLTF